MRSSEEVYYDLLSDIQEFKQHLSKGSLKKPDDLEGVLSEAWDKADEFEQILNSEEFEDLIG